MNIRIPTALFSAFTLALAACGVIPTPPVALPDATLPLTNTSLAMGQVVYIDQDVLAGSTLPSALQGLTISGNALYTSAGGNLSSLKLYIRPSLSTVKSSCTSVPGSSPALYLCNPASESGQAIGSMAVQAGVNKAFSLSGAALDSAAKSGHGYFGVQVTGGQAVQGESLTLTSLKAQARF